jgi:uncharacterized membrane protein
MAPSRSRFVWRVVLAVFFIGAGVMHFVRPSFYLGIMPPYLPYHLELVYVSGVFEIVGGLGLLVPRLRRAAGIGLIALLVAVFPANVHMALHDLEENGVSYLTVLLWLRLPLQLALIAWAEWCSREG